MRELRRLDAWINNQSLRDVDRRILIRQIRQPKPQMNVTYGRLMGMDGQRIMDRRRLGLQICIDFQVRELYDLATRARIVDAANRWAQDGMLQISARPEQRIAVRCVGRSGMERVRDYTDTYTLEFSAIASPYWESQSAETLKMSGISGSGAIINDGSMEAFPAVTVTPTGGTLTQFGVTAGRDGERLTSFRFEGISVHAGDALTIARDDTGILHIMAGGVSAMGNRSADSADELICLPGVNAIAYAGDVACDVDVQVRGRWL